MITDEARDLFLLAINFCIKKNNSGVAAFRRDVFDLYRSGLEKEVRKKLTAEIMETKALAEREWLLEKIRGHDASF